MSSPKSYTITSLSSEGHIVKHEELDPHEYVISKLRNIFEKQLEPLYFGEVTQVIIERHDG